jgi:lycopene cyclase domain-containing protein
VTPGVRSLSYVAVLAFCVVGTVWLEVVWPGVRVYRRTGRLLKTLACVVPVFVLWDLYALLRDQWRIDRDQSVDVILPGGLPLEELLFFVVVPVAGILALEAVRTVQRLPIGVDDEQESVR